MQGSDIFKLLCSLNLNFKDFDWFENKGLSEFELLISVILTQNTNWKNVLKALESLRSAKITSLEHILKLENTELANLIKASGFYNTKAKRIKGLCEAILRDFENLQNFKAKVSRQWLLNIKGLGFESADGILNYLCNKEILVVDSYTNRLALALGYEFESYEELREFFESGISNEQNELCKLLGKKLELYELYQIFHALIISFAKAYFRGKKLSDEGSAILQNLA
ncbi:nuclease [Campylobacter sp. MIT 99-7217]|uniref:3-methyladenine DNA glycosylase n=1 Tax=Campylobacter sp. MIT 99-7217 TaxID=535091 RepID=UPI00115724DB|nr:3-methyladenine DNA glycosylase [Campylobacter sp. MIT 99-7217]TQR33686.1 nuclease [Campylobacter sp. MIT 99-7217]